MALLVRNVAQYLTTVGKDPDDRLVVADLKGGEGIVVDPEDDRAPLPSGVIERMGGSSVTFRDDLKVTLRIVQPRAFHLEGPIREWDTTVGAIKAWVRDVLVPAMDATAFDHTLDAGPWCRYDQLVYSWTSLFGLPTASGRDRQLQDRPGP